QSRIQRRLPFPALLGRFTQSLRHDECFGDLGIAALFVTEESAARRKNGVAELLSALKRMAITAQLPPRLGPSHAVEQRVDSHADDEHVLLIGLVHSSPSRSATSSSLCCGFSS